MFRPFISDCFQSTSLGNDINHNSYRIYDLCRNYENRLSNDNGIVWAAEISESERNFQSHLKPTILAGISYNDVARWIDQKINIFRSTVQNIADNAANAVRRTLDVVINGVKHTANSAWNKAVEAVNSITSKVSAGISDAKRYADSIISSVRSTANSAWSKANEVASSVGYQISNAISTAKGYAESIVSSARSIANSAFGKANEALNSITSKVNGAINTAKGYADSIVNSAKSTLNSAIAAAKDSASNAYNKAVEVSNSVGGKISNAINTAKGYADSIVGSAKSTLNSAIAAAKDSASNAFNKAVEVANSVGGKISSAISTAKSYADDVVKTAKDGLNSAINAVKTIASDAYSMAQNAAVSISLAERNLKLLFSDYVRIFENKVKPFTDFIENINQTVKNIVDPLLEPFRKVVETINATVKSLIDVAVKPFNDFISGFKAKTKEILDTALQNAKDYFKGILDNFRSGIKTIKATIDTIVRNINELLAFRKETNSRLSSLESRLNSVANTYVTKVEFTNFKTDVDKRIKLLNTAVSSINTDLKAAFQSFNLSLIDTSNKVVAAINAMNVNMGNLFSSVNDKLNSIISLLTDLNSDNGPFSKISKLFENAILLSKLDNIKSSIDNLAKKDIFDNAIFKAMEKFFASEKFNKISDTLNDIHKYLLNSLNKVLNSLAEDVFSIRFNLDITNGYLAQIEKILDSISNKIDDLIKTVKEIEIPKEKNNTTINEEAETNIWDVLKEAVKTLAEFIKNPAKIIELLINFIRDLIVPKDINFFSNFNSEVTSKFNEKLPFVNNAKNSFTAAFNSPKQFNDLNVNYNFIKFSGSITLPLHYLNDFGKIGKPYITGFLVFSFLISMYGWFISRGTKLNDN